jgi:hypothetical protein
VALVLRRNNVIKAFHHVAGRQLTRTLVAVDSCKPAHQLRI